MAESFIIRRAARISTLPKRMTSSLPPLQYWNLPQSFLSIVLMATLSGFIASGCHSSDAKPGKAAVAVYERPVVATFNLQKGKLSTSLDMPGELIAFQQVDLYAKVNSFVKRLHADVGSEVKTGQVLATMEAPEINSQLAGANSRIHALEAVFIASKANYDRLLQTSKTPGTISPNDLDMAFARQQTDKAQLASAQAAYREVTASRDYLTIRAPFGGVITARNVSAGAYVGPSGKGSELPLFTLQEQKKLRLVVSVPEEYSSYMNNKNEISFTIRSLPDQTFTARIERRAGALDSKLRSQRIEMDVDNKSKQLLPGMVAEIHIPLPAKDSSFIVPETAVINSAEGVFIIKVLNGKALWVPVKKGRVHEEKMEVYGDLEEGERVVIAATEEIRNGSEVK